MHTDTTMARSLDTALASLIDPSTPIAPLDESDPRRESVEAHHLSPETVPEALQENQGIVPEALQGSQGNGFVALPESQESGPEVHPVSPELAVPPESLGNDHGALLESPELEVRLRANDLAAHLFMKTDTYPTALRDDVHEALSGPIDREIAVARMTEA